MCASTTTFYLNVGSCEPMHGCRW